MSKYVNITNGTKLSHMAVLVRLKSPAVLVLTGVEEENVHYRAFFYLELSECR